MKTLRQTLQCAVMFSLLGGMSSSVAAQTQLQARNGAPYSELSTAELALFVAGKADYSTPLTPDQGLGPIFNKSNCGSCHGTGTIIGGPGTIEVTLFGADDKGTFVSLDHLGGLVFQLNSISSECHEEIPPEATIIVNHVCLGALAYGLVDAIPDATLLALADPTDSDGDGISGRAHMTEALEDPGVARVGRFGWKAQLPTTLSFSADAALGEMGLTNRLVPNESAPNGDAELLDWCDTVADPEDGPDENGRDFIDRVTLFQRYIAPPPQTPKSGMAGEVVFDDIGCTKCHVSSLTTADDPQLESFLRNRTFRPYGDFLLHNMGTLGDGVRVGDASEFEMKTPTLWGLRWRDPMLHDGRAAGGTFSERVTEAIQWHGPFGEGAASATAFAALSNEDNLALMRFLGSLGRNEFDYDGDEDVDTYDFLAFSACFAMDMVISPEDACAIGDIDQDGDSDNADALLFVEAFDGESTDCNDNGTDDLLDILSGTLADSDGNGVADICQCPADFDHNGIINGADLAALLGDWGSANSSSDLNGDNIVDGADLSILLGGWGTCP